MLPPLATIPGPSKEYLDQDELRLWLGISRPTLRKLIRAKVLPSGRPRLPRTRRHYWTKEVAAVAKWILDHPDRFEGVVEAAPRKRRTKNNETVADGASEK